MHGVSQPDGRHPATPVDAIRIADSLADVSLTEGDDVAVQELEAAVVHPDAAELGDDRITECRPRLDCHHLDDSLSLQVAWRNRTSHFLATSNFNLLR